MSTAGVSVGDRAAVETPSGNIVSGQVVDTWVRDCNRRPVPFVTVEVSENIRYTVPEIEATAP